MSVVTGDILALTLAGVRTDFDQAYAAASVNAEWMSVATKIETTLPTQNYAGLGGGATMRPYKDRSEEQELIAKSYVIKDALFDALMVIDRRALEDDQYGLIKLRTQDMGEEAVRHDNQIVFQALSNGFNSNCYDGQYFFDTDHQEGGSPVQSNMSHARLSDGALQTARTSMRRFVNDKGIPMGVRPNVLVVSPEEERLGTDLMGSDVVVVRIGDGAVSTGATAATPIGNFWKNKGVLVVSDYMQAYHWAYVDASRAVKPIILQKRLDVPVSIESDMTTDIAKMLETYKVRIRERKGVGYSLWQLAFGSDGSAGV